MAKSKKKQPQLVELIFDALYQNKNVCTTDDEKCMDAIQRKVEKSANAPTRFAVDEVGEYQVFIIHDKYPVLVHFNALRRTVISDIAIPTRSGAELVFHIHDLRDILSYAKINDMTVRHTNSHGQCIPGTRYYI